MRKLLLAAACTGCSLLVALAHAARTGDWLYGGTAAVLLTLAAWHIARTATKSTPWPQSGLALTSLVCRISLAISVPVLACSVLARLGYVALGIDKEAMLIVAFFVWFQIVIGRVFGFLFPETPWTPMVPQLPSRFIPRR